MSDSPLSVSPIGDSASYTFTTREEGREETASHGRQSSAQYRGPVRYLTFACCRESYGGRGGTVEVRWFDPSWCHWNFFIDIKSFQSHYGPGVDSAS